MHTQILKVREQNVTVEELVLSSLKNHGYTSPKDKCLLQCFELSTLERMKGRDIDVHTGCDVTSLINDSVSRICFIIHLVKNGDVINSVAKSGDFELSVMKKRCSDLKKKFELPMLIFFN